MGTAAAFPRFISRDLIIFLLSSSYHHHSHMTWSYKYLTHTPSSSVRVKSSWELIGINRRKGKYNCRGRAGAATAGVGGSTDQVNRTEIMPFNLPHSGRCCCWSSGWLAGWAVQANGHHKQGDRVFRKMLTRSGVRFNEANARARDPPIYATSVISQGTPPPPLHSCLLSLGPPFRRQLKIACPPIRVFISTRSFPPLALFTRPTNRTEGQTPHGR